VSRINTNVPAIVAQSQLQRSQGDLAVTLERLSSGLRINRGADDPAGLILSERLRAEIAGVTQAVGNSERAVNVIATTEGALNEVAALLIDIQDLVAEAANTGVMSDDEIRANQLQIDSAVESITRIANTTTFAGRNLVDGSLDYTTSGVDGNVVHSLQVHGAQFGWRDFIPVEINVTQSAQQAELFFANSQISQGLSIEVAGSEGVTTLTFVSGTTASAIAEAVNMVSDATGIEALLINSANPASGMIFRSNDYGSDAFVSVRTLPGSGSLHLENAAGEPTDRDVGQDAAGTINGAQSTGDGLSLMLNTAALDLSLTLDGDFGTGTTRFYITGGGSLFQIGPEINTNQQVNLGVQSVAASRLGNGLVGYLSQVVTGGEYSLVAGKAQEASAIVDEAVRQVSVLRGRLGSFERNTLRTNIARLETTMENLTSSESAIRDADFAAETSRLARAQLLVAAGTSVLTMANTAPQTALTLLQG
jgi:flagellin